MDKWTLEDVMNYLHQTQSQVPQPEGTEVAAFHREHGEFETAVYLHVIAVLLHKVRNPSFSLDKTG